MTNQQWKKLLHESHLRKPGFLAASRLVSLYNIVFVAVNNHSFRVISRNRLFESPQNESYLNGAYIWQCELGKWSFISKRHGTCYEGHMFPLLVKEQLDPWPEKNVRRRLWVCFCPVMNFYLFIFFLSSTLRFLWQMCPNCLCWNSVVYIYIYR